MSKSTSPSRPKKTASPFRTPEQRAKERQKKRDALLLAAARAFNAKGFFAASLDDVAASLGVTKPVIYHYLGNKEQVLFECLQKGMVTLFEAAEKAKAQNGRAIERLRAFLRAYALSNMTDFGRCIVLTTEEMLSAESAARFRKLKREIDSALRDLVQSCIDEGTLETSHPKFAAFAFVGALSWPARWYQHDGQQSPKAIADALVEVVLGGTLSASERERLKAAR